MKNKKYIIKSVLLFLSYVYALAIHKDAMFILGAAQNFQTVCFAVFTFIVTYLSLYYCLKNINIFIWEKLKKEKKDD